MGMGGFSAICTTVSPSSSLCRKIGSSENRASPNLRSYTWEALAAPPGAPPWALEMVSLPSDTPLDSPMRAKFSRCLLYTSDAADDLTRVDLGGRRIIQKQKIKQIVKS